MEKQFRYDFQTAVVETDKGLVHGYESLTPGPSVFTTPNRWSPGTACGKPLAMAMYAPSWMKKGWTALWAPPTGSAYRMKTAKISTCGRLPATTKNAL